MASKENKSKQNIYSVLILLIFVVLICIIAIFLNNNNTTLYSNIGIDNELLNVIYFNVGQADSTLITINGYTMLIDTGNNSDGYYIAEFLKAQNINKIDYLILTHSDEDHIGGAAEIIGELDINIIYTPDIDSKTNIYSNLIDTANQYNVKTDKTLTASDDINYNLGKATWKVLNIDSSNVNNTNDSSIVIELSYNNTKYLFMGDATTKVEKSRTWNTVDVLKVGHHGSKSSTGESFLDQVNPKFAIISTDGRYNHPSIEVLNRLMNRNIKIYRTDQNNSIWLTSNGIDITVQELNYSLDGKRQKAIKLNKQFIFYFS